MKIISKHKDYYDYLVGIYGEDPKLIYDRTDATPLNLNDHIDGTIIKLKLANKEYHGLCYSHKIYWPNEIGQLFTICDSKRIRRALPTHHNDDDCVIINLRERFNISALNTYISLVNGRDIKCDDVCVLAFLHPVYSKRCITRYIGNTTEYHVILQDINFYNRLSAQECWIEISNFLSKKVSEKESQVTGSSNEIKIQSAGFDLKTSFRPKIKK